jgi:hypothetical protein
MSHFTDNGGFAASNKGARIDCLQFLLNLSGNACAGRFRQRTKFGERISGADTVRGSRFDTNQNSAFGLL